MSDQNVKELERQRPGKIGKAVPTDNYNESRLDDRSINNAQGGQQMVFKGVDSWLAIVAMIFGALGFLMGAIALSNSNKVADFAFVAGEAKSKAETATARANVSEIYAKQVYTELNRLGYPVRTPAEDHAPQPSDNVAERP